MSARQQRYGCDQLGVCQGRQPPCTAQCPGPSPAEGIEQERLLSGLRFSLDEPSLSATLDAWRDRIANLRKEADRRARIKSLQTFVFGLATGMALVALLIWLGSAL